MNNFTVIASAFRAHLTANDNLSRHEEAVDCLIANNMCDFKTVVGVYHEEGMPEASREVSLMIQNLSWAEVNQLVQYYCGDLMAQDCVLVMNQDNGRCTLKHNDWNQELGHWTQVTRDEAHEVGIYTLDTNGNYWMAK